MELTRRGKGSKLILVVDGGVTPTGMLVSRAQNNDRAPRPRSDGYSRKWIVERTSAWLEDYRPILGRHKRLVHVYYAFALMAFILIRSSGILK